MSKPWSGTVRVAVVSDTHGFLDPRIAGVIASCAAAVHAGDIGCASVLAAMKPRRRLIAIRGNNDTIERWPAAEKRILRELPSEAVLDLPGGKLVVVHGDRAGAGDARHRRLRRSYPDARAVVYGHSHRLVCDRRRIPWILNSGAAGRTRTFGGPSCLVLAASAKGWRVAERKFKPLPVGGEVSSRPKLRRHR